MEYQKTAEETSDLIGNKTADKFSTNLNMNMIKKYVI